MATYSAVVFDICGVLIEWNPRLLYRKIIPDETAMERFLEEICNEEWNLEHDAGRPLGDCIDELVARYPDWAELIQAWKDRFAEMMRPMDDSIRLLQRLHSRGIPLYALSNFGTDTFELTYPLFPFLEWFSGIVLSGQVGVLKPDPGIYEALIRRFKLDATQTIFVDDNLENVMSATRLGMHAIRFESARRLEEKFAGAGLL